jgi:hypothetical protein
MMTEAWLPHEGQADARQVSRLGQQRVLQGMLVGSERETKCSALADRRFDLGPFERFGYFQEGPAEEPALRRTARASGRPWFARILPWHSARPNTSSPCCGSFIVVLGVAVAIFALARHAW